MPPEQGEEPSMVRRFELEPKSWPQLLQHVKYWRTHANEEQCRSAYQHIELVGNGHGRYRVYAIGPGDLEMMTPNTLLVADYSLADANVKGLHWRPLCHADKVQHSSQLSEAQKLMLERRRSPCLSGIQNYSLERPDAAVVFVAGAQIHSFVDSMMSPEHVPCSSNHKGRIPLDAVMCPANSSLSAYVNENDVYVRYVSASGRIHLDQGSCLGCCHSTTDSSSMIDYDSDNLPRSAGVPSFVMQEEFDRFTAMWWQPKQHSVPPTGGNRHAKNVYYLMFEIVDECDVSELDLSAPGTLASMMNLFRYPLVGTANAQSSVHLLKVTIDAENWECPITTEQLDLPAELRSFFPWVEYLTRAGWVTYPDGTCEDRVWLQLLSRDQCRMAVVVVNINAFGDLSAVPDDIVVVYDKQYEVPYLTTDCMQWLPPIQASGSDRLTYRFLHIDDSLNNYAHIVLVTSQLDEISFTSASMPYRTCMHRCQAVTTGDWPVITQITVPNRTLFVRSVYHVDGRVVVVEPAGYLFAKLTSLEPSIDWQRQLVYFDAVKDDPLEMHVYVAPLLDPTQFPITRLTPLGHNFRVATHESKMALEPDFGFVAWRCSLTSQLQVHMCAFKFDGTMISGVRYPTSVQLIADITDAGIGNRHVLANWMGAGDSVVGMDTDEMKGSRMSLLSESFDDCACASSQCIHNQTHQATVISIRSSSLPPVQNPSSLPGSKLDHFHHPTTSLFSFGGNSFDVPEIYAINHYGTTYYAMLLRPVNWQPDTSYPVLVHVYAGPEVQLVNKQAQTLGQHWKHRKYQQLGYAVVMIDGPGTANRGRTFENMIRKKMGQVEIDVQVSALQQLANITSPLLDLSRVAIFGSSYGGYTSLLALQQRPDVFKVAIAGSPVTSWHMYDTAYTERYMGMPDSNSTAYMHGSVIDYAHLLPDEPDRLLLMHGLCDENVHVSHTMKLVDRLIKLGKPYALQIYPRERHGVRSAHAHDHMEATMLSMIMKQFAIK